MKKRIAIFLAAILILTTLTPLETIVNASQYDANVVVTIANNYLGSTKWPNLCLGFVSTCFYEAYGISSSSCCAYKYGSSYIDSTSRSGIPIGADVFFGGSDVVCGTCGNHAGHIGIYVGDGYIIHSWSGKVQKSTIDYVINCGYPYRGYGWHGNVALGDAGYLSQCTKYPSYYTATINTETSLKSLPYSSSETVTTLPIGTAVTITAVYRNTWGYYWCMGITPDGQEGFIAPGYTTIVEFLYDDVIISNPRFPQELTVSSGFYIEGIVSSTYNQIHTLGGYIYPSGVTSGSSYLYGSTVTVDGKSYDLYKSAIDTEMKYSKLSAGSYNSVITANVINYYCPDGSTLLSHSRDIPLVEKPFVVGNFTKYSLDVNGLLDNQETGNVAGYGTFDVIINGVLEANDVTDYYAQWSEGTQYEITDIRAESGHTFMDVAEGSLIGTIGTSNVSVRLSFVTGLPITDTPVISSNKTVYTTSETVTLTRNTVANTNYHWIVLYLDNEQILSTSMPNSTYTLNNLSEGKYHVFLQVGNMTGSKTSEPYYFYVENQHYWNSGEVIQQPTCTSLGIKRYTCTNCGATRDETIPKTAHNYETTVTPPTCTTQGYTTHTCSACGDTYKDNYTAALGHNYSYTVTTAPTVTAPGVLTGTCSRCNAQTSVALPKLTTTDYTYTVTKAATCTATGTGRYTWKTTTYGTFYFDVTIPKTAHNYQTAVTPPTCTAQGYTTHTCSVCGDSYKDSYTDALGHAWDNGVVTKPATETEPGIKLYTCTRCGTTRTETIPAIGHVHNYTATVIAPTCTAQGYTLHTCTCGDSYKDNFTAALGHDYGSWTTVTAATCTASGTEARTCARCGQNEYRAIPALGHAESDWIIDRNPSCTASGYKHTECTRCGVTVNTEIIPATGHKESNWITDKAATCTASGTRHTECTICGATIQTGVIAALGHAWDDGVVITQPTLTEPGEKLYICSRCGDTKTETIPATGLVNPFVDVKEGDFFYDAVLWAYYHDPQVTAGTSKTKFSPAKTCTREQVVTFLWRAKGCEEPTSTNNPFKDVPADAYYTKAVLWAVENGITNGKSKTKFGVGDSCTREQVVTFLWRAEGEPEHETVDNPFTDVSETAYSYNAILWAVEKGITNGTSKTKFSPTKTCTRGEVVTFLWRNDQNN